MYILLILDCHFDFCLGKRYALDCSQSGRCYNGTNPAVQQGALLAIPNTTSMLGLRDTLKTIPGKKIYDALMDFGGYIVDDAAGAPNYGRTNICYEAGVDEEVKELYGLELSAKRGTENPLYDDLLLSFQQLQVVINNGPQSIGGGGAPIAPTVPPLCPP
eukprot:m.12441 g.12441  ORF g.12441 m.12441 type:complete len:160 (-) comp4653_c0_seq1:123-602(-)